jgi:hypothetical protein
MNEILLNILSVVVTAVILPLISYIGVRLTSYLNNKIKDEKARVLLTKATEVVTNATRCVFQTYVESLKADGKFTKESQIIALNKAKGLALAQLGGDVKKYIEDNYGDINEWLGIQIEASINCLKNR